MAETQPREPVGADTRIVRVARPLRGRLVASIGLAVLFVVYTFLDVHWSVFLHLDDTLNRNYHVRSWWTFLHIVDRIGQRAVCLPILAAVTLITGWRHRSWRPPLLALSGVFLVNFLVLIAKLAMARGRPLEHGVFFSNGDDYPSGHTANIVVVYGLCYSVLMRYTNPGPKLRRVLLGIVLALPVIMFWTSLLLRWHWFSDLVGGFIIGGAVLLLLTGLDAWVPFSSPRLVVVPSQQAMEALARSPESPAETPRTDPVSPSPERARAPDPTPERAARPWEVVAGNRSRSNGVSEPGRPAGSPAAVADRPSRR
jgi:membrane-associated phospholipid phosphatase